LEATGNDVLSTRLFLCTGHQ